MHRLSVGPQDRWGPSDDRCSYPGGGGPTSGRGLAISLRVRDTLERVDGHAVRGDDHAPRACG
jgi:hypothetical protein